MKCLCFLLQVDAHAEECFFDKVKMGTKMGLMFEVAEGGFLDIDVRIEGPDGKVVHQVKHKLSTYFLIIFPDVIQDTAHALAI